MNLKKSQVMQHVLLAVALTLTHQTSMAADAPLAATDHAEHAKVAHGTGVIKEINAQAGTVTLAHDPIPELNWPAMTMPFKVAADVTKNVSTGQKVTFELTGEGNAAVITKLEKAE